MKNTKFALFCALSVGFALTEQTAHAQLNTLVQTSLSASITATQTIFNVASATGIVGPSSGAAGSSLYVMDFGQQVGEFITVVSVSGTTLTVSRAQGRSKAHASGSYVMVATVPNWFQTKDPSGTCVTASTYVTPYLNINTGAQWLCAAGTTGGTWVPGWGNTLAKIQVVNATVTASVGGTTAVNGPLLHINGTNAITAFLPSLGWNGDPFCVIPDAAYTTTTGGTTVASTRVIAIEAASTAVTGHTMCFNYDTVNSKFVASY